MLRERLGSLAFGWSVGSGLIDCGEVGSYEGEDDDLGTKYSSVEDEGGDECTGGRAGGVADIRRVVRPGTQSEIRFKDLGCATKDSHSV